MIYSKEQIEILREGGKRLAVILNKVAKKATVGISVSELNDYAEELIKENGDRPAFLNYQPSGAVFPYPASLCVSVNDEIVHGIPKIDGHILKDGDIVSLDLGLIHKGLVTDSAVTVIIGKGDKDAEKLVEATRKALYKGIGAVKAGARIGDIGYAIENFAEPLGFGVVDELGGHGVGKSVHEEPFISNTGKKGKGPILKEGMVLALEPMLNEGTHRVVLDNDGYTFRTADGKRSAHFEHTIVVTKNGAEILTELK